MKAGRVRNDRKLRLAGTRERMVHGLGVPRDVRALRTLRLATRKAAR